MTHGTGRGSWTRYISSVARLKVFFFEHARRAFFDVLISKPHLLSNKSVLSTSISRKAIFAVVGLLAPFGVLSFGLLNNAPTASATINEQLHFQARLLTSSGSLVPDGNYNVQFNIYSGGDGLPGTTDETLEWTGSYLKGNTQTITVTNGYVSANLGESASSQVNTLANVSWNNSTLWLSINIGNTASTSTVCTTEANFNTNCGGDGEMGPFVRLGSTPYAFNSKLLGGRDETQFVQLDPGGTSQAVNTANAVIDIDQAGVGDLLNLKASTVSVLSVATTGNLTTAGDIALNGGNLTSTAGLSIDVTDTNNFTITDGTNTLLTVADGGTVGNATITGTLGVTGATALTSTLAVNGANVTVGTASTTNGSLILQNSTNALTVTIDAPNQTIGSAVFSFPDTAGVADTVCLETKANCGSAGITLQVAYDTGNTITTAGYTAGRDILFTLTNEAPTDSNFLIDIATGSTSKFAVQGNSVDVFTADTSNITSTVPYLAPDGAYGATAYSFSGNTALGLYRSGTSVYLANGAGSLQIDSSGDAVVTSGNLYVKQSTNGGASFADVRNLNTDGSVDETAEIQFGFGATQQSARIVAGKEEAFNSSATRSGFLAFHTRLDGDATPEKLRITGAGLVGINTTTPTARLEVVETQPTILAGAGTDATQVLKVTGAKGGDTSGTTGQLAGTGSTLSLTSGAGGDAPSGSTNGNGGDITIQTGAGGAGLGTAGTYGNTIINSAGGNVGIGDSSPAATLTVGNGDLFQVAGATGNITTSGDLAVNGADITSSAVTFNLLNATPTTVNAFGTATVINLGAGTGTTTVNNALAVTNLLTGSAGLTVTGAAVNLNASSNFATNINTGTSTGAVSIGGGSGTLAINSTAFNVSTAGAVSGVTTLGLSGAITGATSTNTINGLIINSGALSGITGYTQTSGNFSQTGTGTFGTGTGAISLNGNTTVTGTNTLTVGTGATTLGGTLGVTGATTLSSTLAVNGASVTVGTASTTNGSLILQNSTNALTVTIDAPNQTVGSAVFSLPDIAGAGTAEICVNTTNNCGGLGGLQAAYGAGNTIDTTDARNISFTLTNTATDPNFDLIVATGSTGAFRIYDNATLAVSYDTTNGFSVPGAGGIGSDQLGYLASADGTNSLAVGNNSLATGGNSVSIGRDSVATPTSSLAIGYRAKVSSGSGSIAIGLQSTAINSGSTILGNSAEGISSTATAFGSGAIGGFKGSALGVSARAWSTGSLALGVSASAGTGTVNTWPTTSTRTRDDKYSIALGYGAQTTTSNQLVIGSDGGATNQAISDVYIGEGVTSISPSALTVHATGGSGTDIAAAGLTVAGGQGTGTGVGGSIILQTAPAGSTGTALNALVTRLEVQTDGDVAVDTNTLFVDATNNRVGIGTATPSASLQVTGSQTASAWGFNGIQLQGTAATYTDSSTAGSGTATNAVVNSFAIPTLAATNLSVITTNAANVYIAGAPTAGTNQTLTNSYALWVDAGEVRLDDGLIVSRTNADRYTGFRAEFKDYNDTGVGITAGNATSKSILYLGRENNRVNGGRVIYDHSTSTLQLLTNGGTGYAQIDSNGMFGINDSTPDAHLEVSAKGTTGGAALYVSSTDTADGDLFAVLENGKVGIGTNAPSADLTFGEGASRTVNVLGRTTNAIGNDLTVSAGAAGSGASAFAGGVLTLQGGAGAGTGNANGGNVVLNGGAGIGTGTQGLIVVKNLSFSTSTTQSCAVNCTVTQANVDATGVVTIDATAFSLVVTLPDPSITTAGRIVYITAANGSNDFTLSVNGGGQVNEVAMRADTSATMIWNGTDWTAAGASSSTTLQSAYDNTLTSAGGAEIVLNPSGGAADGLTIRNNDVTPINGGILEVQSAIGTNLFSVNNLASEHVSNGGAEDSTTFATDWTAVGSATISRNTTTSNLVTGLGSTQISTTAVINDGVRNNLATVLSVSTSYTVSFAGKLSAGTFTTLDVQYSRDGGTALVPCTSYSGNTLVTTGWTKITCTITADATIATNADIIIRQTDAIARIIYIDNLSITENDTLSVPDNVQIGGGINGGPVTLFTLDRASSPPVANGNTTYLGSMYYDTVTGRIQCYEADGWGACGSPPNNIITLTPEYAGAVLNGTGVGTMTADFCADQAGVLQVNSTVCATGEAVNYYGWTSPQVTSQTYSIYLTYQLPSTFKKFIDDNTITLDAYSTNTTDANVDYEVFRNTGTAISACGTSTTITTINTTWQTVSHNGNEATGCSFAASDRMIFKINVTARNNASVYVSDINFTYTNQ